MNSSLAYQQWVWYLLLSLFFKFSDEDSTNRLSPGSTGSLRDVLAGCSLWGHMRFDCTVDYFSNKSRTASGWLWGWRVLRTQYTLISKVQKQIIYGLEVLSWATCETLNRELELAYLKQAAWWRKFEGLTFPVLLAPWLANTSSSSSSSSSTSWSLNYHN